MSEARKAAERNSELLAMCNRLRSLMGWEPHNSHIFEIIRATGNGRATALSIEKGNQLADRIESLTAERDEAKQRVAELEAIVGHECDKEV